MMEALLLFHRPSTFMTLVAGLGKTFTTFLDEFWSKPLSCCENKRLVNKQIDKSVIRFIGLKTLWKLNK